MTGFYISGFRKELKMEKVEGLGDMELEERDAGGTKPIVDIVGQTLGNLRVLKHLGFLGKYSAFLCQCKCGKKVIRRGSILKYSAKNPNSDSAKYALFCIDCVPDRKRGQNHGFSHKDGYSTWQFLRKKNLLCKEWTASVKLFFEECIEMKDARYLIRLDREKLFGPDNFIWSDHTEKLHLVRSYREVANNHRASN